MDAQFQSSVIFVQDIPTSRQFYEGLLGQQVLMDHGTNVGYVGGFALWQAEHAHQIIFERPCQIKRLGHDNYEIYFETDQLDAMWTHLSEAGVQIVHTPVEQPWGQRVFRVYDPDGHIVELAEPMPAAIQRFLSRGMSVEQIAQRTAMPLEIVRQMAAGSSL
jgi:catechol 2,3-dioxygenase-like lactoylglutathione lyase family enzyme